MSAQNVMASIGLTLGNRDSKPPAPNEIRFAGDERRKDKLYEPKHKQKLVRVLTVVAYVIFVSMAAILLSLYYTFVWNPKDQAVRKLRIEKSDCAKSPSLDLLTILPIFNETQIERMTARSTTINNKQLKEMDMSTTQRQKSLLEILTETTDIEETSVELTSISTVQDYRNNFTSTINVDDNDSVT
ncbi:general transcriptional corepressor trfa-like isoform x2 protein [Lasius niger]|uniref:General transcriptional corepressor trfa-like isoform x2 protein n=1 Tax=Lasius niger TaxID=67767 RepID=A0A0J7KP90_LASNI|nr:general transcriptional corepressor trfa-like isoform x2 protein [Lasius niger]